MVRMRSRRGVFWGLMGWGAGPRGGGVLAAARGVCWLDGEDAVEAGDFEELHELGADAAEDEVVAACRGVVQHLVEGEDDADGLAGEVFDAGEVEDDAVALVLLDELEQAVADLLEV